MDQQISTNEEAVSSSFVSEYESPEIAAKRRKKHNSSVSRNVVSVNVLSVLKLNVKALKIKNINEIFKEYSKNPYYMAKRGITYVLAHAFGIIPVVTDNPGLYQNAQSQEGKKNWLRQREKRAEREIEIIYEKICSVSEI